MTFNLKEMFYVCLDYYTLYSWVMHASASHITRTPSRGLGGSGVRNGANQS